MIEQTKTPTGASASPLPSQYLRAPQLLESLFAPQCRPSIRWLRSQQARLPHVRVGRLVYFDPLAVKAFLDAKRGAR